MLGRFALVGVTLVALGAPAALAGPNYLSYWKAKHECENLLGLIKQCSYQFVTGGDYNTSKTKQVTEQSSLNSSTQFSYTKQHGDNNTAYTAQYGTDQSSKTIQIGDGNFAGTYQNGSNQESKTVQIGNGGWSATSSIGDNTTTSIVTHSW